MPRMTRAESQARTRETLVATATELFLRDGYAATSRWRRSPTRPATRRAPSTRTSGTRTSSAWPWSTRSGPTRHTGLRPRWKAPRHWRRCCRRSSGGPTRPSVTLRGRCSRSSSRPVPARTTAYGGSWRSATRRSGTPSRRSSSSTRRSSASRRPMPASDCATALLSLGVGLGVQRAIDPDVGVAVLPSVIRLLAGG